MKVKFLISGDSPEVGAFAVNDVREVSDSVAKVYISRGWAERVVEVAEAPVPNKPKNAVKEG